MRLLLTLMLACGPRAESPTDAGPAANDAAPDAAPDAQPDAAPDAAASTDPAAPPTATVALEDRWGAVLARDGQWFRTTPGDLAAGSRGVVTLQGTGTTDPCGEAIAPADGGMIIPPPGSPTPQVQPAPAILASLVERAAWRLDELLPEPDLYSPLVTSPDPTKGRGVDVGSVAKVRRHLAPPVLVAAGHRDCNGALALLSADASQVLGWHGFDNACEPLRVLPPTDLDGDGRRELAVWSRSRVLLYGFTEGPGDPSLTLLSEWTCR